MQSRVSVHARHARQQHNVHTRARCAIAVAPPLTSSLSRGMSRSHSATIATVPKRSRDVRPFRFATKGASATAGDRKSVGEGKSVEGRVAPGGRRINKKKNTKK